jgi:predicted deacetylase
MRVHLTLHDVSPAFVREIDRALELCERFGAKPALLVVPNYHRAFPLAEHPDFCKRLRGLADRGHEVYLHGLLHQADMTPRREAAGRPRGLQRWFAQRVVSAGEAEFSDLGYMEAAQRLDEGLSTLHAVGLRPHGFVPPAWSMPPWVRPLLGARNLRYTEDHLRVYDAVRGSARATLLINWATRSRARLWSTLLAGRALWHAHPLLPVRLALHPHDFSHPRVAREIATFLARAQGHWVANGADLL